MEALQFQELIKQQQYKRHHDGNNNNNNGNNGNAHLDRPMGMRWKIYLMLQLQWLVSTSVIRALHCASNQFTVIISQQMQFSSSSYYCHFFSFCSVVIHVTRYCSY